MLWNSEVVRVVRNFRTRVLSNQIKELQVMLREDRPFNTNRTPSESLSL